MPIWEHGMQMSKTKKYISEISIVQWDWNHIGTQVSCVLARATQKKELPIYRIMYRKIK